MASAGRRPIDMPGLFTPPHQSSLSRSNTGLLAPVPRFAAGAETTGRMTSCAGARKRTLSTVHIPESNKWSDDIAGFPHSSEARSPPPLANDDYELAGGMERPDSFTTQNGDYDDYFDLQQQRGMWSTPITPAARDSHPIDGTDQITTATASKPWVLNQILSIVGGVAGKLVQFCSVPFRGFQAGGGQAYEFTPRGNIPRGPSQDQSYVEQGAVQGPLPGEFPEENYGVVSLESLEHERPRMTKRLRTGENWVVVDHDLAMDSRPSTPRLSERRVPSHVRSPSHIPRPSSRAGTSTSTPKRPSLIPVSRRSTIDRKSYRGGTPEKGHSRSRSYGRQSYGSPAILREGSGSKKSPLPPDSRRLVNKMRKEKLEDDARMRRMSSQMSAMLKEAREALGSRFEVEDDFGGDIDMGVDASGYER